ncbi:MAG: hypothetical protein Q8R60_02975 [Mycobacteriales bacterium]|nr:hypothetical protein [Mycobacteriales bacterium]
MAERRSRLLVAAALAGLTVTAAAFAGATPSSAAPPGPPVNERVDRPLVARGSTPAVRSAPRRLSSQAVGERENPTVPDGAPRGLADPVRQAGVAGSSTASGTAVTDSSSFLGLGVGETTFTMKYAPPDTNAAVGLDRVVQTVNVMVGVYAKNDVLNADGTVKVAAGKLVTPAFLGSTLFGGLVGTAGGRCATRDDGDPVVQYDQDNGRWLFSQFVADKAPYLECVAVSKTSDPTGEYWAYAYSYGTDFPDYPKIGVWPGSYVVTYNTFRQGRTFNGAEACALDRAKMITGAPAAQQCFKTKSYASLMPADQDGPTAAPTGTDAYVLNVSSGKLRLWRLKVDWTTTANSRFTGPVDVSGTAAWSAPCSGACVSQPGTTQKLDGLADRLMYRLAYRNRGGTQSLLVNHSVGNGSGVLAPRWYELRPSGSGLAVEQQGTYAPDATSRWMGSIAMNRAGDIALAYSASSGSISPALRWAGRPAGSAEATGTLGDEVSIIAGAGSQVGLSRWGDYSSMDVDPSDDCTFWFTSEYLTSGGSFNWSTRIAKLKVSSCGL